jgi:stage IV sporulation protein FB
VFLEPNHTPYDLRWRMFGTDVRVHPLFWLMSLVLGWSAFSGPGGSVGYLLLWVACVFVSILLHEFGHILMGRLFGAEGHIVLYGFGGLAVGSNRLSRRWQRMAVAFAGPAAQLLLWALLWLLAFRSGVLRQVPEAWFGPVSRAWAMLYMINLFWPLLNLLPIWPLDGGQISRDLLEGLLGSRGTSLALGLSLVVAGLLAVHCLMNHLGRPLLPDWVPAGGLFGALLFGWLAADSYMALQAESQKRRYWDDDSPWGR